MAAIRANTTACGGTSGAAGAMPQFGSQLTGACLHNSSSAQAAAGSSGCEVDYDIFLGQYWPRFDMRLTRDLDPSLVFAGAPGAERCSTACTAVLGEKTVKHVLYPKTGHCGTIAS
jgi:hypothetical protein